MGDAVHVRGSCYLGFLLSFANGHLFPETFVYAKSYAFPILKSQRSFSVIPGQCCEAYGLITFIFKALEPLYLTLSPQRYALSL